MSKILNHLFIFVLLCTMACNKENLLLKEESTSQKETHVLYFSKNEPLTKGVLDGNRKWNNGSVIQVTFLNGNEAAKNIVKKAAEEWQNYANITFEFVENPGINAKVRILFGEREISWAKLGRIDHMVDPSSATVEFSKNFQAWAGNPIHKVRATGEALRILGHVLGLDFEYQNPVSGIVNQDYPIDELKQYLKEEFDLTDKEVENVFKFYNKNEVNYTEYDPKSIMSLPDLQYYLQDSNGEIPIIEKNNKLSDLDKKFIAHEYPKSYHNGYLHNLSEPDWEKLKTIRGVIGGTRDLYGNYYFYKYHGGTIEKYNSDLEYVANLGPAIGGDYRIAPIIFPTKEGALLLRQPYSTNYFTAINIDKPSLEYIIEGYTASTYNGFNVDYYNDKIYKGNMVFDVTLNHWETTYDINFRRMDNFKGIHSGLEGIILVGRRYKWTWTHWKNTNDLMNGSPTFCVYDNAEKDILDNTNFVMYKYIPSFIMQNGAYTNVYEYNDKLIVVRFGGTPKRDFGSILILSPKGNYKIYTHNDAIIKPYSYDQLCGGFLWKSKMFAYDESHSQYYFEFPELDDPNF